MLQKPNDFLMNLIKKLKRIFTYFCYYFTAKILFFQELILN